MKTIYIAGGMKKNAAVNVLKHHLEALGHRVTRDAKDPLGWDVTLRWGVSYHGNKPALNAKVNQFDKYSCFEAFGKLEVPHPKVIHSNEIEAGEFLDKPQFPVLARKYHHIKGKDIVVCKTWDDIEHVQDRGQHDFYSVFIPTDTEYRMIVFREKVLAVYEKVYKGEGEYQGFMRNLRFGFKFMKKEELRNYPPLKGPSTAAVKALGMDFGGVDVIKGKDGKYYVLEVNSMPHIDNIKRSAGVRLAAQVSKWAEGL